MKFITTNVQFVSFISHEFLTFINDDACIMHSYIMAGHWMQMHYLQPSHPLAADCSWDYRVKKTWNTKAWQDEWMLIMQFPIIFKPWNDSLLVAWLPATMTNDCAKWMILHWKAQELFTLNIRQIWITLEAQTNM